MERKIKFFIWLGRFAENEALALVETSDMQQARTALYVALHMIIDELKQTNS